MSKKKPTAEELARALEAKKAEALERAKSKK